MQSFFLRIRMTAQIIENQRFNPFLGLGNGRATRCWHPFRKGAEAHSRPGRGVESRIAARNKETRCFIRADLPVMDSHLFALDSVKTPTGCAGTENSSGPFGGETPFCGLFSGDPFLPVCRETFSPEDFSMFSWSKICMTFGAEFSS